MHHSGEKRAGITRAAAPGWRLPATAMAGTLALLIAACSGGASHSQARKPVEPAAKLTISPVAGTANVKPDQGITVTAARGEIMDVSVSSGHDPVSGSFNATHTAWHSTGPLHPAHRYTVTASAVGASHKPVTSSSSFRTMRPRAVLRTHILEGYHQTYGVGMPVTLTFNHAVTHRQAVERSMRLWSSKPVTGAWYWDGDKTLVFRPRTYWPQHTTVRFTAHLDGVEAARGVYGMSDLTQSFRIGNSLIAVVSTANHHARIYYKNKLFGVWPVSTGSPGDDTANGTYLTIEKGNPVLMSGPGYTDFPVPYSVRFTWSGNYMHDAYWSVGEQGYVNVSHGCVNLSPAHAQTYYNLAVPGDPVTVTGSPVAGYWDDGWTEWFLSWKQLLHGSATHEAVRVGPDGSTFVSPTTLPPVTAKAPLHTPRLHNFLAR